jgi:hypothetical protein
LIKRLNPLFQQTIGHVFLPLSLPDFSGEFLSAIRLMM